MITGNLLKDGEIHHYLYYNDVNIVCKLYGELDVNGLLRGGEGEAVMPLTSFPHT
jgi:hypothetical protein